MRALSFFWLGIIFGLLTFGPVAVKRNIAALWECVWYAEDVSTCKPSFIE